VVAEDSIRIGIYLSGASENSAYFSNMLFILKRIGLIIRKYGTVFNPGISANIL